MIVYILNDILYLSCIVYDYLEWVLLHGDKRHIFTAFRNLISKLVEGRRR